MDKDFILSEIKRTAEQNGGAPLGKMKFAKVTGIKMTDWYGKYWSRWGDALAEAGYRPNEFQSAIEERRLLEALASLSRELGRFPVEGELSIKARQDKTFPSRTVFMRLGSKIERVRKLLAYCTETPGFDDIAAICLSMVAEEKEEARERPEPDTEAQLAFVYLARMGKYYKIGHTGSVGRRQYEIALQLPEKLTLVHSISTDDPAGIDAYWHKRFERQRANGEWFELSAQDVRAFKRRTFM
jgi:Meiotically up-regulated gene 113